MGRTSVWDRATGRRLVDLRRAGGGQKITWPVIPAAGMALSPDGRRRSSRRAARPPPRIIDLAARRTPCWRATPARVAAVAFSPDGRRVATASVDRTARVWDADTGQGFLRLVGHRGRVRLARGLQPRRPPARDPREPGGVHVRVHDHRSSVLGRIRRQRPMRRWRAGSGTSRPGPRWSAWRGPRGRGKTLARRARFSPRSQDPHDPLRGRGGVVIGDFDPLPSRNLGSPIAGSMALVPPRRVQCPPGRTKSLFHSGHLARRPATGNRLQGRPGAAARPHPARL